jgi:hypothetical protein
MSQLLQGLSFEQPVSIWTPEFVYVLALSKYQDIKIGDPFIIQFSWTHQD